MKDMDLYSMICYYTLMVGGLVLGLEGLFGFNLLTAIFGMLIGRVLCIAIGGASGYLGYRIYLDKFKK